MRQWVFGFFRIGPDMLQEPVVDLVSWRNQFIRRRHTRRFSVIQMLSALDTQDKKYKAKPDFGSHTQSLSDNQTQTDFLLVVWYKNIQNCSRRDEGAIKEEVLIANDLPGDPNKWDELLTTDIKGRGRSIRNKSRNRRSKNSKEKKRTRVSHNHVRETESGHIQEFDDTDCGTYL